MGDRAAKTALFDQFARVGRALASGKRLELLDLFAQGERTVDALARATELGLTTASAHLQTLKAANLVTTRRDGTKVYYRLDGIDVAQLLALMRAVASTHLPDVAAAASAYLGPGTEEVTRDQLLQRVRCGQVTVLDVRPRQIQRRPHPRRLVDPLTNSPTTSPTYPQTTTSWPTAAARTACSPMTRCAYWPNTAKCRPTRRWHARMAPGQPAYRVRSLIRAGRCTAVVGPSGAGKSTLLRVLNRLEDPTAGRALLDGRPIGEMDVLGLRRRVGLVAQRPVLLTFPPSSRWHCCSGWGCPLISPPAAPPSCPAGRGRRARRHSTGRGRGTAAGDLRPQRPSRWVRLGHRDGGHRRTGRRPPRSRPAPRPLSATAGVAVGTITTLGVLLLLGVIAMQPRVVVPVGGMIVSAAMLASGLTLRRLREDAEQARPAIEARLCLGLSAREAFLPHQRSALRTALLPAIDSTKVVGLISLPGAMTGLILAGRRPAHRHPLPDRGHVHAAGRHHPRRAGDRTAGRTRPVRPRAPPRPPSRNPLSGAADGETVTQAEIVSAYECRYGCMSVGGCPPIRWI